MSAIDLQSTVVQLLSNCRTAPDRDSWDMARESWIDLMVSEQSDLGKILSDLFINVEEDFDRGYLIVGLAYNKGQGSAVRMKLEALLLSDDEDLNREDIVEALDCFGDVKSIPVLIEALHKCSSAEVSLRVKLIAALGILAKEEMKAELKTLLQTFLTDDYEQVREEAELVLEDL